MRDPTKRELKIILGAIRHALGDMETITGYPYEDVMDKDGYLKEMFYSLNSYSITLCKMIEEVTKE